ncbi:hypothetical protein CAEBREN_10284 [Caenorhabditis brenneri]|uniref:Uncharacterized protein n=1 Tax=Caenorhabditis brenneri TaxID=135651 RepID=G0NX53_CAEBE|nr:hypothetical protein CAEBREN_10284 [Caenorhabditis brenneri]
MISLYSNKNERSNTHQLPSWKREEDYIGREDEEYVEQAPRQEDQRRRAPSGGRTPYRPPSRGEENREVPMAPRRSGRSPVRMIPPVGQARVPPAQPPRQPPSRGQAMERQERRRLDILREEQIARQQLEQSTANGDASVNAIKEEAAVYKFFV